MAWQKHRFTGTCKGASKGLPAPGGAPMSLATEWRSMYSLMSKRSRASGLPKYWSASTCRARQRASGMHLSNILLGGLACTTLNAKRLGDKAFWATAG